jgi:hypothetical protein
MCCLVSKLVSCTSAHNDTIVTAKVLCTDVHQPVWQRFCPRRCCVAVRAPANPAEGHFRQTLANPQAFITYSRQGNDRLLQFYGFVEADNPADTYVVCNLLSR